MKASVAQNPPRRNPGPAMPAARIHQALLARGSSVNAWSAAHGYPKSNVYRVIHAWIEHPERRGRMPLGGLGREIVLALRAELGADLVPLTDEATRRPALERAA